MLVPRGGQWKRRKRSGTGADTDCPWEGTREGSRWQTARGGNLSCGAPAIMPWYGLSRSTSVYWCSRVPNLPAWCSCRAALFLLPSTLQPTLSTPAYTPARASPSRTTPSTHHLIPWHTHPHAPSLPPAQTPAGDEKPRGNGEALETKPLHIIVAASISVVRRHATQIPLHLLLGQVALAQSFSLSLPPLSCLVSINGPAPAAAAPTPALPACACCCRVFLGRL